MPDCLGIFNYTAFFLLVPLAIASAHYLREFLSSWTPFGLRVWFHVRTRFPNLFLASPNAKHIIGLVNNSWNNLNFCCSQMDLDRFEGKKF